MSENKKKHAYLNCFQGKRLWMEALFFSALSCSFRRLHKAQGCWSLSYFCGFWSGSMFHWSSLSSPFLSNLCCRHVHGLYIHSQHCHTFHQSAVSPYKLSDFFPNAAGFTVSTRPCRENWVLIKRSQRKLSVSITTKASHSLLHTFINSQGEQANEA